MFAGVAPARLRRLAAGSVPRTVGAGATVARYAEPATHLIVVEAGALTATRDTAGGRRLRLGGHPAPCAVDKAAVLDGAGYTATWTATGPTRVRLVPAADFRALLDDEPAVRRHVLRHLAGQVRDRQDALVDAHYADATARVVAWLLARPGPRIPLTGAQQGLAEAIGASRVTVNRALRALARDGLIRTEPGAVVIVDRDALRRRGRTGP